MNEEQNEKKYYLGLDIGTDSVGWCVTDRNYNIVRKESKHLWGARLFSEAQDASKRRNFREARRRLERRRWRILLLQDIFKDEMDKKDPNFFDRLNNSAFHMEDKAENTRLPCLLFNDENYSDKEYYKEYPTIYHLREKMIDHPEIKFDIRMIYLVMAHMIKYRGNFIKVGKMENIGNDPKTIIDLFNQINDAFDNLYQPDQDNDDSPMPYEKINCTDTAALKLIEVFKKNNKATEMTEEVKKALEIDKKCDKKTQSLLSLICGSEVKISKLFVFDEELSKEDDVIIELGSSTFDGTTLPEISSNFGDEKTNIIILAKSLYDYRVLANILQGKEYISEAMVEIYNEHKKQLKELKDLIKRYSPKSYSSFFRKTFDEKGKLIEANYSNYVGYCNVKGKEYCGKHSTNEENLYKAIKAILPIKEAENPEYQLLKEEDRKTLIDISKLMEANKYLPRQNSGSNGVLPYQLNEMEMNKIIDNQKKYYPFLGEMDTDYLNPKSQSYKINSILTFKIPYYVGPLSDRLNPDTNEKFDNHWAVKSKQGVKITPWNFHDIVDKGATEEQFIENLKNPCSYLIDETTLPKFSLLYTEFVLLNEMNNWLINGLPITSDDKKYLFEKVYLKYKKPGIKAIKASLKDKYSQEVSLKTRNGKDVEAEDIHANLSNWIDMASERGFGPGFYNDLEKRKLAEDVIYNISVFEDKKVVSERLDSLPLTEPQKRYFSSLSYKGWGKLSERLLNGMTVEMTDTDTGEVLPLTVIQIMRKTSQNFMEIVRTGDASNGFMQQIYKENVANNPTLDDLIDSEYASPAMKRSLRQTMKIIAELKKILHIDHFDTCFVECTRSPDAKKERTMSRKTQLQQVYAAAKGLASEINLGTLKNELESVDEQKLRSKKYFLYFMQLGKSVYTGEQISLDDIDKNYDIDHIIPQAKVKDDSFNNTVLVERGLNIKKSDLYPIPDNCITEKGREWVDKLSHIGNKHFSLMPSDKAKKIKRPSSDYLTDDELVGFVNRQLTMTDQSVKAVCDLIKQTDSKTKVVFSKASLVSDFRNVFDIAKCREINDFHHAHDAYLNIVVGNVYNKTFSSCFDKSMLERSKDYAESLKINPDNFFRKDKTIFNTDTKVWIAKHYDFDEHGNPIEDPESKGTIDLIRKSISRNDPLVTQMMLTQTGFINKTHIHSPAEKSSVMPLKFSGPFSSEGWQEKYGGYNELTAPFYMLIRSESKPKKGKPSKHIYSLENIPTVDLIQNKTKEQQIEYLKAKYNLLNPEIVLDKILIRGILEFSNSSDPSDFKKCTRMGISCKSNNVISYVNLFEFKCDVTRLKYIKQVEKKSQEYIKAMGKDNQSNVVRSDGTLLLKSLVTKEKNIELFEYLLSEIQKRDCIKNIRGIQKLIPQIVDKKDAFVSLSILEQCYVISQLIVLINCKKMTSDLVLIGLPKNGGSKTTNKKLPVGTRILAQSVTGFYEKVLYTIPED